MEISCSPYFPVLTLFKLRVELEFPPYVRSDFRCNANVCLELNWDLFPIFTVQIVLDTLLESHSSLGTGAGLSYDFCVWVFLKYIYIRSSLSQVFACLKWFWKKSLDALTRENYLSRKVQSCETVKLLFSLSLHF